MLQNRFTQYPARPLPSRRAVFSKLLTQLKRLARPPLNSWAVGFAAVSCLTFIAPTPLYAQVDAAYSNSHGASRTSTYDNSEDLNLDAELAVENRFNLPQHEASTNHRSLQAAKSSAAGPVMPLDLDNTPAPRAPASTQRHIASEKAQAQEPTASTAQHSTMHDLKSTPTEQTAENSMTASMQDIKNQSDELQLQLNDTQQQNQHRAQYIKVLEHDVKQAQTQLQQLKIELQQARNETKRYVQATKKLNRKIKTINEKIKSTTRQIATTYEKQNGMKQELHKNLNEYKQKQQQLAR